MVSLRGYHRGCSTDSQCGTRATVVFQVNHYFGDSEELAAIHDTSFDPEEDRSRWKINIECISTFVDAITWLLIQATASLCNLLEWIPNALRKHEHLPRRVIIKNLLVTVHAPPKEEQRSRSSSIKILPLESNPTMRRS
jgi:hypothetical protein